ncbi:MAG TPA: hypothetical protein VFS21_08505 [Roseiflexaceae bacterium]|nr:hypothetical protein [Roseiflexaceae bacterium]
MEQSVRWLRLLASLRLRREAGEAATQARAAGPQEREALAAQLETVAEQADGQPGAPWQTLAAHLRELTVRLK